MYATGAGRNHRKNGLDHFKRDLKSTPALHRSGLDLGSPSFIPKHRPYIVSSPFLASDPLFSDSLLSREGPVGELSEFVNDVDLVENGENEMNAHPSEPNPLSTDYVDEEVYIFDDIDELKSENGYGELLSTSKLSGTLSQHANVEEPIESEKVDSLWQESHVLTVKDLMQDRSKPPRESDVPTEPRNSEIYAAFDKSFHYRPAFVNLNTPQQRHNPLIDEDDNTNIADSFISEEEEHVHVNDFHARPTVNTLPRLSLPKAVNSSLGLSVKSNSILNAKEDSVSMMSTGPTQPRLTDTVSLAQTEEIHFTPMPKPTTYNDSLNVDAIPMPVDVPSFSRHTGVDHSRKGHAWIPSRSRRKKTDWGFWATSNDDGAELLAYSDESVKANHTQFSVKSVVHDSILEDEKSSEEEEDEVVTTKEEDEVFTTNSYDQELSAKIREKTAALESRLRQLAAPTHGGAFRFGFATSTATSEPHNATSTPQPTRPVDSVADYGKSVLGKTVDLDEKLLHLQLLRTKLQTSALRSRLVVARTQLNASVMSRAGPVEPNNVSGSVTDQGDEFDEVNENDGHSVSGQSDKIEEEHMVVGRDEFEPPSNGDSETQQQTPLYPNTDHDHDSSAMYSTSRKPATVNKYEVQYIPSRHLVKAESPKPEVGDWHSTHISDMKLAFSHLEKNDGPEFNEEEASEDADSSPASSPIASPLGIPNGLIRLLRKRVKRRTKDFKRDPNWVEKVFQKFSHPHTVDKGEDYISLYQFALALRELNLGLAKTQRTIIVRCVANHRYELNDATQTVLVPYRLFSDLVSE